jgi:urease accessory protein
MAAATFAALLLADGRFPAGGHVHSAGVEEAVADGRITDVASLEAYVTGRLATTGLTEAALAAATARRVAGAAGEALGAALAELDAEADARVAAPALRAASRRLGRQLARVAGRCWPHPVLAALAGSCPQGAHQPVALGAAGVAAGLGAADVARLAVHHATTTPAQAAVRLLGLDPYAVAALTAALDAEGERTVAEALAAAEGPLAELPARTGPLVEIAAVAHERRDGRMFAT